MQNRPIPKKCDIIVIGGGPAGSIAAGLLAKDGYEVVLLEKKRFPRNAVGESLIPHFWKFTDLIGASEAIEKENFMLKKGGLVRWDGVTSKLSFRSFGFERPALHVERDIFDQILSKRIQQLGVSVYEEVQVKKVIYHDQSKVTAQYKDITTDEEGSITATYVVDASGQQAVIAKQEKMRDFDQNFGFQAVWGYFDQSHYYDKDANLRPFEDRFDHPPITALSEIGTWGWSWQILLRDKVSVGIILPKSYLADFKKGGDDLSSRFNTYAHRIPLIGKLLESGVLLNDSVCSIRDYAYKSEKIAFQNCYLAGDSAAFIDPVSTEGVPMSMYGGYLTSWAISNSLKNRKRKDFYQQLYINEYGKRLQIFKILAYPAKRLPASLIKMGQKIIQNFSEQEILLILAQARLTGRYDNICSILGDMDIRRNTEEVDYLDNVYEASIEQA